MDLKIKDKIGQDKKATKNILEAIDRSKKLLLVAPMASGKTYLIVKDIKQMAFKDNKKVIIVIPNVKHIGSMETEYGIGAVCDGKSYGGENIVAVTPDSLPKVMAKLEKNSYYLIIDEAHEKYSSVTFRKSFKNIPLAESQAYKTIYTTATPQNLDIETFDQVITVDRAQKLSTTATILEVDNMGIDTLKAVIQEYESMGSQTIVFNNNIKENRIIADFFHDETEETHQVLLENYQIEIDQDNAVYAQEQEVTVLHRAETIKASDKGTEIDNAIRNGYLPKEVDLLLTTSALKAGINIANDPEAVAIVVCKRNDFNLLDQIQSIGRFRNGLKHVVFVLLKRKDKAGLQYDPLEVVRESRNRIIAKTLDLLNTNLAGAQYVEEICKACYADKKENGLYETDTLIADAEAFNIWAKNLLNFPNTLRKQLLSNQAIHFKDIEVKDFNIEAGEELKEVLKEHKEEQAKKLKKAIQFISKLDDDRKIEVLDYTLDQRKADIETVENMKTWHKDGNKKKLEQISRTLYKNDLLKAFDDMATRDISTINKNIRREITKIINQDINKLGAKAYLQDVAKGTIEIRTAKIRYELRDIEKSRGRVTQKEVNRLARILLKEDYLPDKTLKKKDVSKMAKEKAFARAAKGLGRELKLIYNFKDGNTISSVKTK